MLMLPLWKLEQYVEEDGSSPILLFISGLPEDAQAEAEALRKLLQADGDAIKKGQMTSHGNGLFEIAGEYVRIFCKISDDHRVILIDGLLPSQDSDLESIRRKADLT
jgi:hypothetical protein